MALLYLKPIALLLALQSGFVAVSSSVAVLFREEVFINLPKVGLMALAFIF